VVPESDPLRRNDLDLYERNAAKWWDVGDRTFRSLRSVGRFHVDLIEREWGRRLAGAELVDLGCGGGLIALALAELGARVTGIDRSPSSVRAARDESARRSSASRFVCSDLARSGLRAESFDLAVLSDVLEHVVSPERAVREASRLIRPGGRLFLNTFDRTWTSSLLVVTVAEGLGLVPKGTHDPRLFVRPAEIERYGRACGLSLERVVWERPALLQTVRTWSVHLREARHGHGFSAFLRKGGR
jgi:2-polyprenyl-6-hydroxyphenyl methylase/3-demethylubiquinone-9 3-methyltransferase